METHTPAEKLPRFTTFKWDYFYGWLQMQLTDPLPKTRTEVEKLIKPYMEMLMPYEAIHDRERRVEEKDGTTHEWWIYHGYHASLSMHPVETLIELQRRFRIILSLGYCIARMRTLSCGHFSYGDDEKFPSWEEILSTVFEETVKYASTGHRQPLPGFDGHPGTGISPLSDQMIEKLLCLKKFPHFSTPLGVENKLKKNTKSI